MQDVGYMRNGGYPLPAARSWQPKAGMAREQRDIRDRAFKFGCDVIEFCDSVPDLRATTRYALWQLFKAGTSVRIQSRGGFRRTEQGRFHRKNCDFAEGGTGIPLLVAIDQHQTTGPRDHG